MSQKREEQLPEERSGAKTILVVEDDDGIGNFLVQAISQETQHQVLLVNDAFQALKAARAIKPGLFILDYQLPGMNGIELFDQLHAIEELATVPTILVSARLPQSEIQQRKIVGMSKPLELDELLQTIERLLGDLPH
jgi:DNA-binding response OmpR family regulator